MKKETTKECNKCGSTVLILLRSLNMKICGICDNEIPWYLEKNQKPLL